MNGFSPDDEFLAKCLQVVREVGEFQMRMRGTKFSTQLKDDESPVTEIDRHSHKILKAFLLAATPGIDTLSEESSRKEDFVISEKPCFWCIDPLDGTRDYISSSVHFAINIALFENGQVTWGLIHHPASQETLISDRRQRRVYFLNARDLVTEVDLPMRVPYVKKILTSARIGLTPDRINQLQAFIPHLDAAPSLMPISSSYKFFLLLKGNAQAYIRKAPCMHWDVAPGFLAAELAGLNICHLNSLAPFNWPERSLDALGPFGIYAPPLSPETP